MNRNRAILMMSIAVLIFKIVHVIIMQKAELYFFNEPDMGDVLISLLKVFELHPTIIYDYIDTGSKTIFEVLLGIDVIAMIGLSVAIIIYFSSRFSKSALLRFFWLIIFIYCSLMAFLAVNEIVFQPIGFYTSTSLLLGRLLGNAIWATLAFWVMQQLHREHAPRMERIGEGAESYTIPAEASKGQRFVNRLVDMTIFSMLSLPLAYVTFTWSWKLIADDSGGRLAEYIFAFFYSTIVYSVTEFIWQTSPGKLLTRTRVTTATGGKPQFLSVVGRSMARFIPFEPFSFLGSGNRGWHDTMSNTYVAEEALAEEQIPEDFLGEVEKPPVETTPVESVEKITETTPS
jgi:uncharacterized RDD family membrane protein YckC